MDSELAPVSPIPPPQSLGSLDSKSSSVQIPVEEQKGPDSENPMTIYEPSYNYFCCTHYKDRSKFQNLLENIDLSPVQKQIIKTRYLNILENFQRRARNYGIMFYLGHTVITVGSLFVPALLSVQNSDKSYVYQNGNFTIQVYWATFILSLLVTIFNGILTLFKIDKKYYFLNTTLERLRTEGWQYFSLTGRYSGQLLKRGKADPLAPSHRNQFIYFTHYVEKIKMKQVEEEYYKTDERSAQTPNQTTVQPTAALPHKPDAFSPTPDITMDAMASSVPEPARDVRMAHPRLHPPYLRHVQPTRPSPHHPPSHRASRTPSHSRYSSHTITPSESSMSIRSGSDDAAKDAVPNEVIHPVETVGSLITNPLYQEELENRLHAIEKQENDTPK